MYNVLAYKSLHLIHAEKKATRFQNAFENCLCGVVLNIFYSHLNLHNLLSDSFMQFLHLFPSIAENLVFEQTKYCRIVFNRPTVLLR